MSTSEGNPQDQPTPSFDTLKSIRTVLGMSRVDTFSAFDTEDYLQRTYDKFRGNPDSMHCGFSNISGGEEIIRMRRYYNEQRLRQEVNPLAVPVASGLNTYFRLGVGLVEKTVAGHYVSQANALDMKEKFPNTYITWLQTPLDERRAEMRAYMELQHVPLLTRNFFDAETEGTILNYASTGVVVNVPRVTGEETFVMRPDEYPEGPTEVVEGTLAALYLLREHHIAQTIYDIAGLEETPDRVSLFKKPQS